MLGMLGTRMLLTAIVVGLLVLVWMTRLSVVTKGEGIDSIVTDRWFNTVYSCNAIACDKIYPSNRYIQRE